MENDYHNPYDTRRLPGGHSTGTGSGSGAGSGGDDRGDGSDQLNHYEAPSCLVRNPSGSLFIPPSGNFFFKKYLPIPPLSFLCNNTLWEKSKSLNADYDKISQSERISQTIRQGSLDISENREISRRIHK